LQRGNQQVPTENDKTIRSISLAEPHSSTQRLDDSTMLIRN
jgi:hypothetical protein